MNIFSIETSCDETALSFVKIFENKDDEIPSIKIVKEIVASQIDIHKQFGGVVPSLAKREHEKNLPILFEKINANRYVKQSDFITVTVGPGLEPALWTGINFAKKLSEKYEKRILGVNHLLGHLYSFLLSKNAKNVNFPAIFLLVSGGHTILSVMENINSYKKIGETYDDSVGEAFDKVARMLGYGYPGGPIIEKEAKKGDNKAIKFPSPMINQNNFNFSYSGLKTSVLYFLKRKGIKQKSARVLDGFDIKSDKLKRDIAASFQYAAFNVLAKKTIKAVSMFKANSVIIGGGVSANRELKKMIESEIKISHTNVKLFVPPFKYCMDNAVMIALAGYFEYKNNIYYPIEANGMLSM